MMLVTKLQVWLVPQWSVSLSIEGNATFQFEVSENKDFFSPSKSARSLNSLCRHQVKYPWAEDERSVSLRHFET